MVNNVEIFVYAPKAHSNDITLLISPELGVDQSVYKQLALFLSGHGYTVVCFNSLSAISSGASHFRQNKIGISNWAESGIKVAIDYIKQNISYDQLYLLGHGLGGYMVTLALKHYKIDGMVLISVANNYWGHAKSRISRFKMCLMSHVFIPVLARLLGYFPGKAIGLMYDLPKHFALEWAKWCRSPDSMFEFNKALLRKNGANNFPILAYSFTDDKTATSTGVDSFISYIKERADFRRHIDPKDLSVFKIGNLMFFNPSFQDTLWKDLVNCLNSINELNYHATKCKPLKSRVLYAHG